MLGTSFLAGLESGEKMQKNQTLKNTINGMKKFSS